MSSFLFLASACALITDPWTNPDQVPFDTGDPLPDARVETDPGQGTATDSPPVDTDTAVEVAVDADGDGFAETQDCDDGDPDIYPAAEEQCDAIDHDCDGLTGFEDDDGDGVVTCMDCDDAEPLALPGELERCDGVDNDCNGAIDDSCEQIVEALGGIVFTGDVGDNVGISLDLSQDLTGDGQPDLAVGYLAPGWDSHSGVYVVDPATGGGALSKLAHQIESPAQSTYAGAEVRAIPDATGDGYADLVIGALFDDDHGAALLFEGPITGPLSTEDASLRLADHASTGWNGFAIAGDTDLTGDGVADVAISAPATSMTGVEVGATLLYPGPLSDPPPVPTLVYGAQDGERFGDALSTSDVNGDGVADLIVVSRETPNDFGSDGSVFVVLGPITGDLDRTDADVHWRGSGAGIGGQSVAAGGDADDDGYTDTLVGRTREGTVYLMRGGSALPQAYDEAAATYSPVSTTDSLGPGLAWSQLNELGGDDIAIGNTDTTDDFGAVYVFYDTASGSWTDEDAHLILQGPHASAHAGYRLHGGSDFDGDGRQDLVVTATQSDEGANQGGEVYLLSGAWM